MKKLTALVLALMMALSLTASLAEEADVTLALNENFDITLDLPDGYVLKKNLTGTAIYAEIYNPDAVATQYTLSIAKSDVEGTLTELTDDMLMAAQLVLAADFHDPQFSTLTTKEGTVFLVINEHGAQSDYAVMISYYQSNFVSMYITPVEGAEVAQADLDAAFAILESCQLVK